MRSFLFLAPALLLAACASAPVQQNAPQSGPAQAAAPFTMPMDPGALPCAQLGNPAALAEATEWTLGLARAAVLSGRLAAAPDAASTSAALAAFCAGNGSATLRAAAASLGV